MSRAVEPGRIVGMALLVLAGLSLPAAAYNGAVAIAVPVQGIKVDGDLSDWPKNVRRYPIAQREANTDSLKDAEDFQGSFRIGYNAQENALYLAVEVKDESIVPKPQERLLPNTQDGCEISVVTPHQRKLITQYAIWGTERLLLEGPPPQAVPWKNATVEVQRQGGRHVYEWRIEIDRSSIGELRHQSDTSLGLDVAVWDKDEDGSASLMLWGEEGNRDSGAGQVVEGKLKSNAEAERSVGNSTAESDSSYPYQVVSIERAAKSPVIDGHLEDWDSVQWVSLAPDRPYVTSQLGDDGATEPAGTARTAADLSGAFALQWDEEWIYLAARVTDNVHEVSRVEWVGRSSPWGVEREWWTNDAVTLFLDVSLDGYGKGWTPSDWSPGDHAFSFVADSGYPDQGRWWRDPNFMYPLGDGRYGYTPSRWFRPASPETQSAVQIDAGGNYTLEAAIPMAVLTLFTPTWCSPFENRMLGFLVWVTDPDGGPDLWGGSLTYGKSPVGSDSVGTYDNYDSATRFSDRLLIPIQNDAILARLWFKPTSAHTPLVGRTSERTKGKGVEEGIVLNKMRIQPLTAPLWVPTSTKLALNNFFESRPKSSFVRTEVGGKIFDLRVSHFFLTDLARRDLQLTHHLNEKDLNQLEDLNSNKFVTWKYHHGDQVEWARPEFDDRSWPSLGEIQFLKNTFTGVALPKGLTLSSTDWSGVGWLRLHLTVDSTHYNCNTWIALFVFALLYPGTQGVLGLSRSLGSDGYLPPRLSPRLDYGIFRCHSGEDMARN